MRKLTTLMIMFFALNSFAQTETKTLNKIVIGMANCSLMQVIKEKDSTTYVHIGFRNAYYQQIDDYKSVLISLDKKNKMISDLKAALIGLNDKKDLSFENDDYTLTTYDFNPNQIYFCNEKDLNTYFLLNKDEVSPMINWLNSF